MEREYSRESVGSLAIVELSDAQLGRALGEPDLRIEEGGKPNPKVLFVVNTDWFFLSHRKTIAQAMSESGYDVSVATPDTGRAYEIEQIGFKHEELKLNRWGLNPFAEVTLAYRLFKLYRTLGPAIVHHSTPKVIFAGSLAARFSRKVQVVNLVSGFGSGMSSKPSLVKPFVSMAFRFALRCPRSIAVFQNPDDLEYSVKRKFVKQQSSAYLIRGSGVDLRKFRHLPEPTGVPIVLFASRMLIEKGVLEVVEAAKAIRSRGYNARFILVGEQDSGAERCVPAEQLNALHDAGIIEWLGRRNDMADLISKSAMVVLPTRYKEGLPRILLEAAACGRPIVTTDIPGCKEVARDGVNAFLVKPGDQAGFEKAIEKLLDDRDLRAQMGVAGRTIVINEFSDELVVSRNLSLFKSLVPAGKAKPKRPRVLLDDLDPADVPVEVTIS